MPVRVVDASAICAVLFGEPEAARVAGRLDGAELAAPPLLPFEVANVCLTKIRRQSREQSQLTQAFALFTRMKIVLMAVDFRQPL